MATIDASMGFNIIFTLYVNTAAHHDDKNYISQSSSGPPTSKRMLCAEHLFIVLRI